MPTEVYTALLALLGVLIGYLADVLKTRISVKGDTKNHISKARFDKEFEIYQELSEKNLKMVNNAALAKLSIEQNEGKYDPLIFDELMSNFSNSINDASFSAMKYAPFVDKSIADQFSELANSCKIVYSISKFILLSDKSDIIIKYKDKKVYVDKDTSIDTLNTEVYNIFNLSENTIDKLRKHIEKIDVKEK